MVPCTDIRTSGLLSNLAQWHAAISLHSTPPMAMNCMYLITFPLQPEYTVQTAIPTLSAVLKASDDAEVVTHACWALAYLTGVFERMTCVFHLCKHHTWALGRCLPSCQATQPLPSMIRG